MLVGPSTGQLVVGVNQALSFSDPSQPMRGVVLTNQSVFEVEVLLSNGSDILQPGESNYYAFPAVTRATQVITITPLAAIPSVVAPSNLVNSVIIEASDEPGSYPVFNTSLASLLSGSQEVLLATVLAHASDTVTVDLQADMLSIIVIAPMSIAYQKISCTVQGVTTGVTYPAAVLLGHAYSDFGISVMAARIEPLVDDAVTVTWSGVPIHNWYVIGTTEELSPAIVSAGSQTLDGLADLTDPATVTLVGGGGTPHRYGPVVTTDSSGNLVVDATFTPSGTQDVDIVAPVDGSGYVEVDVKAPNPLPVSVASLPTGDVAITSPVDGSGYVEVDVKAPTNFPVTQVTSPWVTSVSGSVAVTGTFWQATQPVSVSGSVAVTGTFWQATQPVSGTVTADQGTTPWTVAGTAAAGSPPSGDPVLIAGSDGTDVLGQSSPAPPGRSRSLAASHRHPIRGETPLRVSPSRRMCDDGGWQLTVPTYGHWPTDTESVAPEVVGGSRWRGGRGGQPGSGGRIRRDRRPHPPHRSAGYPLRHPLGAEHSCRGSSAE